MNKFKTFVRKPGRYQTRERGPKKKIPRAERGKHTIRKHTIRKRTIRNNRTRTYDTKDGFTVVEALVSLVLIMMAAAFTGSTILCGLDSQKRSEIRFDMTNQLDFLKNRLTAQPFEAPGMLPGNYKESNEPFQMKWTISTISPTLKIVRLTAQYRYRHRIISKKTYMYKSLYIRNIEETQGGITNEGI